MALPAISTYALTIQEDVPPPPPPPGIPPPGVPIDNALFVLLIASIALGYYFLVFKNNKARV